MGKSIVIASGKGGTGKTMVSANLGATLSRLGHQVIVIDMDTGTAQSGSVSGIGKQCGI